MSGTMQVGTMMPPKIDRDSPSERLNLTVSRTMLDRIVELCAARRPIPSKAEMARELIEMALAAEEAKIGGEVKKR